jgi:hypothetical protein
VRQQWDWSRADWPTYELEVDRLCHHLHDTLRNIATHPHHHGIHQHNMEHIWTTICSCIDAASAAAISIPQSTISPIHRKMWWSYVSHLTPILRQYRIALRIHLRCQLRCNKSSVYQHQQQRNHLRRLWTTAITSAKRDSWNGLCSSVEGIKDGSVQWAAFQRTKRSKPSILNGILVRMVPYLAMVKLLWITWLVI